ncbi:hypothetical protein EV361DRAFT_1017082 [Lentinula raphanica]|nr:hypothetical protein EV361DRAFT_1017082 [Lentinula raphanica]
MAPFWYHSGTYCPSPCEVLDSVSGLLQFNDKPELQRCVREADTSSLMPQPSSSSNNGQGDPNQGKSSKKKRKRQRSPSPAPSATGPSGTAASQEPPTSSKKARSDSRAKPKPTGEKKKKSDMYHVKSTNIPEDARGIKRAFEIHIRILWGSVSEGVAPETPSNVDIANFEKKFSNASQVDEVLNQPKVSLSRESLEKIESLRRSCRLDPGTIASAIAQVSDQSLRMTFGVLSSFGLAKWRPDVLGASPTSFYNQAMESIAISSFEYGLQNNGYISFEPNLEYVHNTAFLSRIYRNYVYSHLRKQILKESREQGRLASEAVRRGMYKRRKKLAKARIKFVKEAGYNNRVKRLVGEPECHSDDEDADDGSLHILIKNLRNENTSQFFKHEIDKGIRTIADLTGTKRHSYKKKNRIPHPTNKKSIFKKLPSECPIDWFQPEKFNALPAQIRKRYVDAPVALPPLEERKKLQMLEWALLPEDEFMTKYGDKVRELYKFPTQEELDAMEESSGDDEDEDDEDDMDED